MLSIKGVIIVSKNCSGTIVGVINNCHLMIGKYKDKSFAKHQKQQRI